MAPKRAVYRRPAAARTRPRRPIAAMAKLKRPAGREEEETEKPLEDVKVKKFSSVDARRIASLRGVYLPTARYYGREVKVAGLVKGVKTEDGQWYMELEVSGTRDEELLRILSGRRDKVLSVHLCEEECRQQLSDELLVHAMEFEEVTLGEEGWMKNLKEAHGRPVEEEDEMRDLRREQELMEAAEKKVKKDEKKDLKKKKREEGEEGRRRKSPRLDEEGMEIGQKSLEDVFSGTGMDPSVKGRSKVLKRARKLAKKGKKGKKKKEKGSSSSSQGEDSSTSSSSSLDIGETGIFEEEKRLRTVWKRCPGALSSRSIQEIKRNLVTAAGTAWEMDKQTLPPIYTQYCRQVVMPGMGASLQQEVITVSQTLDLLAQGKIAAGMDVLNQRLKSLEALGRGAHWTMCRQYELVKTEEGGMTETQEKLAAARQAREEDKLKSLMNRAPSGKGGDYQQPQGGKARKGKEKGSGKNQPVDAGKNRGGSGSGGKDDKAPWPKK